MSRIFVATNQAFCRKIIASRPPKVERVWAFNGAALELFRWASAGRPCIFARCLAPIGALRRLLAAELERWPDWRPEFAVPAVSDPLAEREEAEWSLADQIIAGSQFVIDEDAARGSDGGQGHRRALWRGLRARFDGARTQAPRPVGRLRVLFAGEDRAAQGRALPCSRRSMSSAPATSISRFAGRLRIKPRQL